MTLCVCQAKTDSITSTRFSKQNTQRKPWDHLDSKIRLRKRFLVAREFDIVPLLREARYLVEKPKAAIRFRRQEHADNTKVFVDSGVAGDPVSGHRTGLVAQIGNHSVKSGSTLARSTALGVGVAEFHAVVKGGQVGLSLRSIDTDPGFILKVEIQSDSSTAISLTGRLGAGARTKHIDSLFFGVLDRVQDGDLSAKKVLTAKMVQMLARSQSLLQYCDSIANLQGWYSTHHGSHTQLQDDGTPVESSRRRMCKKQQETDICRNWL